LQISQEPTFYTFLKTQNYCNKLQNVHESHPIFAPFDLLSYISEITATICMILMP